MYTVANDEHSANAELHMALTEDGIVTDCSDEHPMKASWPIPFT